MLKNTGTETEISPLTRGIYYLKVIFDDDNSLITKIIRE